MFACGDLLACPLNGVQHPRKMRLSLLGCSRPKGGLSNRASDTVALPHFDESPFRLRHHANDQ